MTILMNDIQLSALTNIPVLDKNSDKQDWVIALQHSLNGCGYSVKIDGSFGQRTLDEVSRFQQDVGLNNIVDTLGTVDANTWQALDNHRKIGGWRSMWPAPSGIERKVDRREFFIKYRDRNITSFDATLDQAQVDGYDAIFDYWENSTLNDLRWLAYALATVYHETGTRIEPVREGFCNSDACSVRAVKSLFDRGIIARNYALPHPNGNSYFGRGLVQLTHGFNYEKMGKELGMGMQLYNNPSLALNLGISINILLDGMVGGKFTDFSFNSFFTATTTDWFNARKIVNGLNKASLIAGYGKNFFKCLT